jgi:hypothetical protein
VLEHLDSQNVSSFLQFDPGEKAQRQRLASGKPYIPMQAKAFLTQDASVVQVTNPQRFQCESVQQDCNPALVAEPAVLGETRFVLPGRQLELTED